LRLAFPSELVSQLLNLRIPVFLPLMPHVRSVSSEDLKIGWIIVARVPILVVNDLGRQKVSTQSLLNYKPMLSHVSLLRRIRMARRLHKEVPFRLAPRATLPKEICLQWRPVAAARL